MAHIVPKYVTGSHIVNKFTLNVKPRVTATEFRDFVTAVAVECMGLRAPAEPIIRCLDVEIQPNFTTGELIFTPGMALQPSHLIAVAQAIAKKPLIKKVELPSRFAVAGVVRAFVFAQELQVSAFTEVGARAREEIDLMKDELTKKLQEEKTAGAEAEAGDVVFAGDPAVTTAGGGPRRRTSLSRMARKPTSFFSQHVNVDNTGSMIRRSKSGKKFVRQTTAEGFSRLTFLLDEVLLVEETPHSSPIGQIRRQSTLSTRFTKISPSLRAKIQENGRLLFQENTRLEARRIFRELDADKSSYIDHQEMKQGLKAFNIKLTRKQIAAFMKTMDEDDDGKVSEDEFCNLLVARAKKQMTQKYVHGDLALLLPSDKGVIHPNSTFSRYWDAFTLLLLLYIGIGTPVEVAFIGLEELVTGVRLENDLDRVLFILNRVIDCFFLIDIFVSFHMQYPRSSGRGWVSNVSHIRCHYLKGWFFVDFVSIIPFWIAGIVGDVSQTMRQLTKLFRLVKLARFLRIGRILKRAEVRLNMKYSHMAIYKWGALIILVCHWLACFWMMSAHFSGDIGETWYFRGGYYKSTSGLNLYAICVYWALQTISTIGYGDVANPQSALERMIAVVAMIIGSVSWAYIVGTMCALFANLDLEAKEFHETMDNLNDFMKERRLSLDLQNRLRDYFRRRRTLNKALRHQALIEMMSPALRGQVASATVLDWLVKVSWMRSGSVQFLESVSLALVPEVYPPHELIPGDHFHILTRGVAIKDVRVHISGSWWGDDMILTDPRLRRSAPAQAITYVETYALQKENLTDILEAFPHEKKRFKYARIWLAFSRRFLEYAKETTLLLDILRSKLVAAEAAGSTVQDLFDEFDIDGNGTISEDEFSKVLKMIGFQPTPEIMENLVLRVGGDDGIQVDEFQRFYDRLKGGGGGTGSTDGRRHAGTGFFGALTSKADETKLSKSPTVSSLSGSRKMLLGTTAVAPLPLPDEKGSESTSSTTLSPIRRVKTGPSGKAWPGASDEVVGGGPNDGGGGVPFGTARAANSAANRKRAQTTVSVGSKGPGGRHVSRLLGAKYAVEKASLSPSLQPLSSLEEAEAESTTMMTSKGNRVSFTQDIAVVGESKEEIPPNTPAAVARSSSQSHGESNRGGGSGAQRGMHQPVVLPQITEAALMRVVTGAVDRRAKKTEAQLERVEGRLDLLSGQVAAMMDLLRDQALKQGLSPSSKSVAAEQTAEEAAGEQAEQARMVLVAGRSHGSPSFEQQGRPQEHPGWVLQYHHRAKNAPQPCTQRQPRVLEVTRCEDV